MAAAKKSREDQFRAGLNKKEKGGDFVDRKRQARRRQTSPPDRKAGATRNSSECKRCIPCNRASDHPTPPKCRKQNDKKCRATGPLEERGAASSPTRGCKKPKKDNEINQNIRDAHGRTERIPESGAAIKKRAVSDHGEGLNSCGETCRRSRGGEKRCEEGKV